ncbi:hypothetical protein ANN_15554 [Periplaneta americana]|uniref:Uncharacterized protein n=1 Tax=Periplaneta americana TaxID=6978 RepID=A0ABQ8SHP3_PERAM|nr:hypothetical protein ANN_15554 [Periplaneta americana]
MKDDNNALSESAMRISYKICHEIARELKTINEDEFSKRCLIILAGELCPQQVGEVEAIRLSRRTVVRRLQVGEKKNNAETDQEEEMELVGSLAEKKLPTEGCTGRNGRSLRDINRNGRVDGIRRLPQVWQKVVNVRGDHSERMYTTVILQVILYGCETWTLILREEQRLRVFENKVLRKIFGAKRDEVTGEWRKLHNAELDALYSSPDIIRNIKSRGLRWAGHVARVDESRNAYRVFTIVDISELIPWSRAAVIKTLHARQASLTRGQDIALACDRRCWRVCGLSIPCARRSRVPYPSCTIPISASADDHWSRGKSLIWDSTCVDTLAPSHLPNTSRRAASAAELAVKKKVNKYAHLLDNYIFVPFAVETFGPWSHDAKVMVSQIGQILICITGDRRCTTYLRQRLSIAIQRGNAMSVLGTLPEFSPLDDSCKIYYSV